MPRRRHPGEDGRTGRKRCRWAGRGRSQRGAALVEAAFILPVVVTLLFGVVEYGFVFKDYLTISNGVRAGARIGAADGKSQPTVMVGGVAQSVTADYDILAAVKSGTSALGANSIQRVVVYNASAGNSQPTAGCAAGTPSAGVCNVYPGSFVNSFNASSPTLAMTSMFGCVAPDYDASWCPTGRNDVEATADYVGVYIVINHPYITKMFGNSRTMADQAVFRVEPQS